MKQAVTNKNPIFIKIESPLLLRRDLLRSTLYTVKILKDYKKLINLKKEKERKRSSLFKTFRETNKTIREFKKSLPIIKKEKPKEEVIKKPLPTKKPRKTKPKKPSSESEKLKQ